MELHMKISIEGDDANVWKAWKSIQRTIDESKNVEINAKTTPIDVWQEK